MLRLVVQLISLALGHGCTDGCATMVYPLIRARISTFGMSPSAIAVMTTVVMNMACSFSQPLFALWSDRYGGRWVALLSPFIAGVGISAAIEARTPLAMLLCLAMCGLAVAAYHPIPAALVGDLWPAKRTFSLAIFLAGGAIGLAVGPLVVAEILEHPPGNAWWILIASAPVTIALLGSCGTARHVEGQTSAVGSIREAFAGRGWLMFMMLGISTLRALTTTGVNLGVTLLTERRQDSIGWTGVLLSAFLFSSGVAGLVTGLLLHPRNERLILVVTAVISLGAVIVIPFGGPWTAVIAMVVAGAALQGVNPLVIAMSQRLVPSGARMASSLVMGWSWGIGGLSGMVVAAFSSMEWAFATVALAMIPAAILAAMLPARIGPVEPAEAAPAD